MGFLDSGIPSVEVTIVRNDGNPDELRIATRAHVQSKKGYFSVDTPIYEGDIVELHDPRGGLRRLAVVEVEIHDQGPTFSEVNHTQATWGKTPAPRVAAIRRVGLDGLHPLILQSAGDLYTDGHYSSAILEAFKAIEIRVRAMSGIDSSGQDLMARAFDEKGPLIDLSVEAGQSGADEQRGLKLVFMGVIVGIRNPKAHAAVVQNDPQRAVEYLAMASVLMRRLDDAEAKAAHAD